MSIDREATVALIEATLVELAQEAAQMTHLLAQLSEGVNMQVQQLVHAQASTLVLARGIDELEPAAH